MKILVTGGAGYIGSKLVPAFLDAGHNVRVLDNFLFRQTPFADHLINDHLEVVVGDARNRSVLQQCLDEIDVIIPLAAIVGAPACDLDETATRSTNFGAIELLLAERNKNQKILIPTTNSGYGVGVGETYCNEASPLNPISLYGRTKVEAERIVLAEGNAISLRLATVFGVSSRMRIDLLVNDFVYKAVTDRSLVIFEGHFRRNFIHVVDVVRGFQHALDNFDKMKDEVYNLGLSSANLSKIQLAEEIKTMVPALEIIESEFGSDPDKRDYIVSNAKIENTGYQPSVTLQQGIRELVTAYSFMRSREFRNA